MNNLVTGGADTMNESQCVCACLYLCASKRKRKLICLADCSRGGVCRVLIRVMVSSGEGESGGERRRQGEEEV